MKQFRAFVESNSSLDNKLYSVVDITHDCVIATGLSWVAATFICDALNEKFCREREAENVQADS